MVVTADCAEEVIRKCSFWKK